jgi:hypothetical protein
MERLVAGAGMRVVRLTVDILTPVPIARLEVTASVVRAGSRVQRLAGSVAADGRPVCRATGVAIRVTALTFPDRVEPVPAAPPSPEASPPFPLPFRGAVGYHTAMETRLARGTWLAGPAAMWLRPRVPLLPDEVLTPLQRIMLAADSGNGIAITLPLDRFTFVNPDLTVALDREPEGEWVCVDATNRTHPEGIGLTQSVLWDTRGPVGCGVQTLIIEPRPESLPSIVRDP